jgi:hypothetical protein
VLMSGMVLHSFILWRKFMVYGAILWRKLAQVVARS